MVFNHLSISFLLRNFLTTCLFIFLSSAASFLQAQNWQPGTLVFPDASAKKGMIHLAPGTDICRFKVDNNADEVQYRATQLKSFSIEGYKTWRALSIPTHESATQTIFAECILSGKASLYKVGRRFYAQYDDEVPRPLIVQDTIIENGGDVRSKTQKKFVKTLLTAIFKDCPDPSLANSVTKAKLSQKNMIKVFSQYNECIKSPTVLYAENIPKRKTSIGIKSGATLSSLNFRDKDAVSRDIVNAEFGFNPGFTAGVQLNTFSPRASLLWSFNWGIAYQYNRYNAIYVRPTSIGRYEVQHDITFSIFKLPMYQQFRFNLDKVTPFFGGGAVFNVIKGEHHRKETFFELGPPQEIRRQISPKPFFQLGLLLSGGLEFQTRSGHRIPVEIIAETGVIHGSSTGTQAGSFKTANITTFSLQAGYTF
jgi:hypothetical protein